MIPNTNISPFPGIRPFDTQEKYLFFGREEQTVELLTRLRKTRFLAVVGVSGSGKSSLVRAGLLPELHRGTMATAGSSWEVAIMRPGGDPIKNLAKSLIDAELFDPDQDEVTTFVSASLTRSGMGLADTVQQSDLPEKTNLLLVVDQFEEIFRFRRMSDISGEEAGLFITLLLEAAKQNNRQIYVVLTMRSDFLGECSQFRGLAEAVNEGEYIIPRLNRSQRKQAIEGPALVGGREISNRLVQRLLNDISDDPDQLPILQHALMRTWDYWLKSKSDGPVDLEHYNATGGMSEALSQHADEIYSGLPTDEHRRVAEKVFKSLTEKVSENRGIRHPMKLSELMDICVGEEKDLYFVLNEYRKTGCTFLMPSGENEIHKDTVIDISHESLMRVWRKLKNWVDDEAQSAKIYRRLADTASLFKAGKAGHYRDPDLQIAIAWRKESRPNDTWANRYFEGFDDAMSFLDDSYEESIREEKIKEEVRKKEVEQAKALAKARSRSAAIFKYASLGVAILAMVALYNMFAARASKRIAEEAILDQATRSALIAQQKIEKNQYNESLLWLNDAYDLSKHKPSVSKVIKEIFEQSSNRLHLPVLVSVLEKTLNSYDISPKKELICYVTKTNNSSDNKTINILNLKDSRIKTFELPVEHVLDIKFDYTSNFCYGITENYLYQVDLAKNKLNKIKLPFSLPSARQSVFIKNNLGDMQEELPSYSYKQHIYNRINFYRNILVAPNPYNNKIFNLSIIKGNELNIVSEIDIKNGYIEDLFLFDDGAKIAVVTIDRNTKGYDGSGKPIQEIESNLTTYNINSSVGSVNLINNLKLNDSIDYCSNIDSEKFAIITNRENLILVNISNGDLMNIDSGNNMDVFVSPNRKLLLSVKDNEFFSVYNAHDNNLIYEYNIENLSRIYDISIHPDSSMFAVGNGNTVSFHSLVDGASIMSEIINCVDVRYVNFDINGKFIISNGLKIGKLDGTYGVTRVDRMAYYNHVVKKDLPTKRRKKYEYEIKNKERFVSYKIIFNNISDSKTANSMQVAEIELLDIFGNDITKPDDFVEPSSNNSPSNEVVEYAIDDKIETKYLNFDKDGSGLTIYPINNNIIVKKLTITTAEDFPSRDPSIFTLYGASINGFYKKIAGGSIVEGKNSSVGSDYKYNIKNLSGDAIRVLSEVLSGKSLDKSGNTVPLSINSVKKNWHEFNKINKINDTTNSFKPTYFLNNAQYFYSIGNMDSSLYYFEKLRGSSYKLNYQDQLTQIMVNIETGFQKKADLLIANLLDNDSKKNTGEIILESLLLTVNKEVIAARELLEKSDLDINKLTESEVLSALLLNVVHNYLSDEQINQISNSLYSNTDGFLPLLDFDNNQSFEEMTIHTRLKLPDIDDIKNPMLMISKGGSFNHDGFCIGYLPSGTIRFELQNNGYKIMLDNDYQPNDRWDDFTFVFRNKLMETFINGVKLDKSLIFQGEIKNVDQILTIGRNIYRPQFTGPFKCSKLIIFNKGLSESEIKNIIPNSDKYKNEQSLVYDLDVNKELSNGYNITLGNSSKHALPYLDLKASLGNESSDLYLIYALLEFEKQNYNLALNFINTSKSYGDSLIKESLFYFISKKAKINPDSAKAILAKIERMINSGTTGKAQDKMVSSLLIHGVN